MTAEQLAADRAVCDAATPGEWHHGRNYHGQHNVWADGQLDITPPLYDECYSVAATDADFIAAARTRWPAALDEIERLRAWLTEIAKETGTPYGRDAQAALDGYPLVRM